MASVDFISSLTQCARQLCLSLAAAAESSRMGVDLYLSSVGQPLNLFVEASVFSNAKFSLVLAHSTMILSGSELPHTCEELTSGASPSPALAPSSECFSL